MNTPVTKVTGRLSFDTMYEYAVRMKVKTSTGWKFQEVQRLYSRELLKKDAYMQGHTLPSRDPRSYKKGAFMRMVKATHC